MLKKTASLLLPSPIVGICPQRLYSNVGRREPASLSLTGGVLILPNDTVWETSTSDACKPGARLSWQPGARGPFPIGVTPRSSFCGFWGLPENEFCRRAVRLCLWERRLAEPWVSLATGQHLPVARSPCRYRPPRLD